MWNGTIDILNDRPANMNTRPKMTPTPGAPPLNALAMPPKDTVPAKP